MELWKSILSWLRYGNDCAHCPAGWEEQHYTDCGTEYDGGCYIYGDDWPEHCRLMLPRFIRRFLSRRQIYLRNHEYDDFEDYWEKEESGNKIIREVIEKKLRWDFICHKTKTGAFEESNKDTIIEEIAWRVRSAYDEFIWNPHQTLRQKWAELIKETISIPVNFVKSYISN